MNAGAYPVHTPRHVPIPHRSHSTGTNQPSSVDAKMPKPVQYVLGVAGVLYVVLVITILVHGIRDNRKTNE